MSALCVTPPRALPWEDCVRLFGEAWGWASRVEALWPGFLHLLSNAIPRSPINKQHPIYDHPSSTATLCASAATLPATATAAALALTPYATSAASSKVLTGSLPLSSSPPPLDPALCG